MQRLANDSGLRPLFTMDGESASEQSVRAAHAHGASVSPHHTIVHTGRRSLGSAGVVFDGVGGLGWSVIGFVAGAVFWHFVGFWGFVSDVMLAKEPFTFLPAGAQATHAPSPEVRSRWLQVADADTARSPCTMLSLDRRTGVTSAWPCAGDHAPLPMDSFQGREDRVAVGTRLDEVSLGLDD